MLSPPPSNPPTLQSPSFDLFSAGIASNWLRWRTKTMAFQRVGWVKSRLESGSGTSCYLFCRRAKMAELWEWELWRSWRFPRRHPKGDGFGCFFPERLARGFIKWGCLGYLIEPADSRSELCSDRQPVNEFLQSCSYSFLEENKSYIKPSFSSNTHCLRLPTSHHVWRPNEFSGFACCQMEACMVLLKSCCVTWEQEDKKACDAWWV